MAMKREITREDLMPPAEYAKVRAARRQAVVARKQNRRLEVGPVATFHFEDYDSMWLQVQEMLYIEKGGEAQIADELSAYNPLIPNGRELVATVLFEIDDPVRRKTLLSRLGAIEDTAFIRVGEETIKGVSEADIDRTSADGKASAVQFIHFPFTPTQISKFRAPGAQVIIGFMHQAYGHMVVMPESVRAALAGDFD
ncbi:MAG: DUF3501 family protein [Rhodospirillales bacterium]|nr:DUF3501 family protein [Rhodospirillales bacterium]